MAQAQKIKLKAQPVKGKSNDVALTIQGELTLDNAVKLKDFLVENLDKYTKFNVKLNSVDSIDLGAMQLLQRFIWDAKSEKKEVVFEVKISEDHRILLEKSGFTAFLLQSK